VRGKRPVPACGDNRQMATTAQALSAAYPLGSRLDERGRLQIAGCDAIALAKEFGTPAYVVAEDDLRARARAYLDAFRAAGQADFLVAFGAKAFPATAVLRLFAEEGLGVDVASAGELHLALRAGHAPEALIFHGNARSTDEFAAALDAGVGLIVIDNFDDIDRLEHLTTTARSRQQVLIRVTPDVSGETHASISTGQADSKFGFVVADARIAIERVAALDGLELVGLHAHIGSQLLDLAPFSAAVAALKNLHPDGFPVYDLGGGLGVAYGADQQPPTIEDYVGRLVRAAAADRLIVEPGRSLVANGAVTLYTVQSVKQNVSRWVAVDGGMSDNLRPMLYGAPYEAHVADRFGGDTLCNLAGKHCESGDVIVRGALLDDPRPGDVVVTPATGAYGFSMANNYNGVPRPPVIFCKDGDARVVVRRESFQDLTSRDVP
jgi:diaminopimelate decarboxylase